MCKSAQKETICLVYCHLAAANKYICEFADYPGCDKARSTHKKQSA